MQDAIAECNEAEQLLWNGGKVRLHYGRAEDLKDYLNLTAIRGEVVVPFGLRPGAVALSFSGQGKASTPGVLEGMF